MIHVTTNKSTVLRLMSTAVPSHTTYRDGFYLNQVRTDICTQSIITTIGKTGKSVPLQAWSAPEGSRKLRFLDYVTMTHYGGKVVSLTHRPPLPPRKYSWYSFLLEAESNPGP